MRLSARAPSLALGMLLLLAPLAACRHGGDGLTVTGSSGRAAKRAAPEPSSAGRLETMPPPRANALVGRAPAELRLLPAAPHQHSGAPASTHTYHLFAPRHL